MEIEQNTPAPSDGATDQQFYGIDKSGMVHLLPLAPYASDALRAYATNEANPVRMELVLNQHQYDGIYSAIEAELNDVDGDTLIPTYFAIPYHTLHAVFPHPSIDTQAEVDEWVANFIKVPEGEDRLIQVLGPFTLSHAKQHWPVDSSKQALSAFPDVRN